MIIKNYDQLAITPQRKQALQIISAGIERVLPPNIIKQAITYDPAQKVLTVNGDQYDFATGRLFVIGGGKAAGLMAQALESIISPDDITAGVVTCHNGGAETKKIEVVKASHPLPGEEGIEGVQKMMTIKKEHKVTDKDLVLCLISGGGSALMPYPAAGVDLADKQAITKSLLRSGAPIEEVNIVRKHLSQVKGGQLGQHFAPARVVSLILSDVVGNDLSTIASGPTTPDPTTFTDAIQVLEKYDLLDQAPTSVVTHLKKGELETPAKLPNCHNYIIGDNKLALEAMKVKAEELGLKPTIVTAKEKGSPDEIVASRVKEIKTGKYKGANILLMGGEPTPTLPDNPGEGGRNQYYTAAALFALSQHQKGWLVASVATDGSDFMPEIAGGIVDNNSLTDKNITTQDIQQYLEKFDSYSLLERLDNSLVITGKTGTNVGDLMVWMV
ncbi:MAG: DUF4147 domain-containing protein [Parcubacteria group bacterium]|nr:DUF4147 domain-containing protein [Parcubacteria group bacterium]